LICFILEGISISLGYEHAAANYQYLDPSANAGYININTFILSFFDISDSLA